MFVIQIAVIVLLNFLDQFLIAHASAVACYYYIVASH